MKNIFLILIVLFFSACEDNSLFIKFFDKNHTPIKTGVLSFETDNYYLLDKVERSFRKFGYKAVKKSRYHIVLTSHYVISCKNPVVHALGADFNGYIRLSMEDRNKEIYRIQKDFKTKVTNTMIDEIVKRMIKDMKMSPSKKDGLKSF